MAPRPDRGAAGGSVPAVCTFIGAEYIGWTLRRVACIITAVSPASELSPELARGLLQLARALLVAARNWTLYPPEHPTVGRSVDRLCAAIEESSLGSVFSL